MSARLARRLAWDIAREYTTLFQRDLELVGVRSPAVWHSRQHIDEQVEPVQSSKLAVTPTEHATASTSTPSLREAQELARARELARSSHAWEQADALRHRILELGYQVEDGADGTRLVACSQSSVEPRSSGNNGG